MHADMPADICAIGRCPCCLSKSGASFSISFLLPNDRVEESVVEVLSQLLIKFC